MNATVTWGFHTFPILPEGQLTFVDKWPMMNPNEIATMLATYLVFVLKIGPLLMEGRNPIQMKSFLVFYNAIKVINSGALACMFFSYIVDNGLFPRKCEHDEVTLYRVADLYWKYMATKMVDLIDTVIYIIRKKYSQVTFLHVYHHASMVAISWSYLKYDPSDHWAFMAVMNCAIHMIMYAYYGLSTLGPRYAKFLWWKKYLTRVQLTQFVLVIVHILIQTYTSECPMRSCSYWVGLSNLVVFIWLFVDFYKRRYKTHEDKMSVGLACTRNLSD